MMNEHEYYCFLKEFWKVTNDGFIIVDPNGVIVDINETYCEFLGKTREQVLGKPIGEVISTTSMYDVLSSARDGDDNVYLQPYGENDNASNVETHAVANRFCFFNEQGELLGAAAQMSFKERAAAMAYSIATEELNYYKRAYEESSEEDSGFSKILGNSEAMQKLKEKAMRVARKDFPVLITGETGTGKELFAQAIHRESSRRKKPIISINCASIPSELLESELFGYDEGAFTGAKKGGKIGKFQLADGGTIFLDEIGNLTYEVQVQLLRALQERKVKPIGTNEEIAINVRLISATNENLRTAIDKGDFREDLYHRINEFTVRIPDLKERKEDLLLFANNFLDQANAELQKDIIGFDNETIRLFQSYSWPGNLRQMKNVIKYATLLATGRYITRRELPEELTEAPEKDTRILLKDETHECELIKRALQESNNNKTRAAQLLGIDRKTLYNKLKLYNLD